MRVLNATQMREADRRTIQDLGVPSVVLMENAGRQVLSAMKAAFGSLAGTRVAILAGRGNNGGDGFVVARALWQEHGNVLVCLVGSAASVQGDARINLDILGRLGVPVIEVGSEPDWERCRGEVFASEIIVDALFGTGLNTPLTGLHAVIVEDVNAHDVPVVSIDLPSGLSADAAEMIGPAIDATMTVTLAAPKLPHVMPPGEWHTGALVVADIGIPHSVLGAIDGPRLDLVTDAEARALLPDRAPDAHKGSFGHVWVVAGSRGKTGAAHLAGMAALKSGAGLATVATPASCVPVVASMGAEYMTEPLSEDERGSVTAAALGTVLAATADVIAIGPGIGTGAEQRALVLGLLERAATPLVLDADALNVLAAEPDRLMAREGQVIVITPHPGEMARLIGSTTADVQLRRVDVARQFACAHRVTVVLKGYRTLTAAPDGRVFINSTGNPGMATGGSGDVLTGMIAAWLGQLSDPAAACRLAVYLHGAAGNLARDAHGEVALTAGDILRNLGAAVTSLTDPEDGTPRD